MHRRVRRFLALAPRERRDLVACWLVLTGIAPVVRRLPPPRLTAWLRHPPRARSQAVRRGGPATSPERLAELMAIAARHHPLRPGCLPRSLGLALLLRARGVEARLCLGVRRRQGALDAHAWVETGDGRPLAEPAGVAETFLPLLPASR